MKKVTALRIWLIQYSVAFDKPYLNITAPTLLCICIGLCTFEQVFLFQQHRVPPISESDFSLFFPRPKNLICIA